MVMRAYLITLRGRIREWICPDIEVLREKLRAEIELRKDAQAFSYSWRHASIEAHKRESTLRLEKADLLKQINRLQSQIKRLKAKK